MVGGRRSGLMASHAGVLFRLMREKFGQSNSILILIAMNGRVEKVACVLVVVPIDQTHEHARDVERLSYKGCTSNM